MHFTNLFATAIVIATTATATPVDLEARNSLQPYPLVNLVAVTGTDLRFQKKKDVFVEFGKLTYIDHLSITELRVKDVFMGRSGVPKPKIDNVVCQRYLNEFGTVTGSDRFTKKKPALIDTNEIPFKWVLCYVVKNS
ncbi:hypothetical protein NM208_g111 [Fusarium decemcellulare]|uniref:Uncharacterized protein n=1 Tax=Fusarium decemcellulare TaxID=57161 RepID=A0ACC1T0T8_9HYPO|nr:hypothetical protein NM208_g111 [Fusarium decemcellulare]